MRHRSCRPELADRIIAWARRGEFEQATACEAFGQGARDACARLAAAGRIVRVEGTGRNVVWSVTQPQPAASPQEVNR